MMITALTDFHFSNVDDIDLFVGGIAETPLPGANVGHTFGCIIGYQFRDLRKGDRYWFENPGQFSESKKVWSTDQNFVMRYIPFQAFLY